VGRGRESGRQQRFAGRPVGGRGATALASVLLQDGPGTVGGRQEILLGHPLDELVLTVAGGGGRV
jgi:hypothetical protein